MDERAHLVAIAAYNSQLEADLVVARLAEAGIPALVAADGLGGAFPGMPMATGGFQVMVAEAERTRARQKVGEMGSQAVDRSSGALDQAGWRIARWMIPIAAALLVGGGVLRGLF